MSNADSSDLDVDVQYIINADNTEGLQLNKCLHTLYKSKGSLCREINPHSLHAGRHTLQLRVCVKGQHNVFIRGREPPERKRCSFVS